MKKDLDYYMSLNYPIEIIKIPEEEGGGYMATIPQLGRNVFVGDGETIEEAIKMLDFVKEEWFKTYLERGREIPLPEKPCDKEYSGKFIVRVSPNLHRQLAEAAKKSNQSLNQYLVEILSSASISDEIKLHLDKRLNELCYKIEASNNVMSNWVYEFSSSLKELVKPDFRPYAETGESLIIRN
ncbi:MAG TPA: toxin-antitoxin system HicB family antitoxin [Candidatus Marinimicrobia bacterium]|nr:toxin-antitoxin system HicB family antitoxin [Candidatus Neomarinimicrobiota bacterium]HRS51953.1 toxin-antitoxin system HicB family antitoxin [Candidatus Neomarinimicrobiota bacterium]HRU91918.1 toxin-antitoxin system HicB family antitoxin [Candidatus Neomarinimicrobiota bacterium]